MELLAAGTIFVRGRVALAGGGVCRAVRDTGNRSIAGRADKVSNQAGEPRSELAPHARNAVDDGLHNVLADMAELVHVAIPDTHQLGNAGKGGFGQIFDAADDAVHQCGQESGTALESFG